MRHSYIWLLLITFGLVAAVGRSLDFEADLLTFFAFGLVMTAVFGSSGWLLRAQIGAINWLNVIGALFGLATAALAILWLVSFIHPWLLILGSLALIAISVAVTFQNPAKQREHWAVSGRCTSCGYDLRASHDRCPECGADLPEEIQRRRRVAADLAAAKAERDAAVPASGSENE